MFNRTSHRARKPMGGEKKASLREALRNRGGAQAAAIVTPAQTDVEDEFDMPEKSGLDWLNLTAFAPKNLQAVIDKLRTDTLPTAVRGASDAEGGKVSSARPALRQDLGSSESEEADPMVKVPSLRGAANQQPNGALPAPAGKRKSGIRAALQARGGMQRAAGSTLAPATTGVEEAPETFVSEVDETLAPLQEPDDQDLGLPEGLSVSPAEHSPLASSPLPSVEEEAEAEAEAPDEDGDGVGVGVFVEPPGEPRTAEADSEEEEEEPHEPVVDAEPVSSPREHMTEEAAEEAVEEQHEVAQEAQEVLMEQAEPDTLPSSGLEDVEAAAAADDAEEEQDVEAAAAADDAEEEQVPARQGEMESENTAGAPEEAAPSEEGEAAAVEESDVPLLPSAEAAPEEQPQVAEEVAEVEASQALEVAQTASTSEPPQPLANTAEATEDLAPSPAGELATVPEEEPLPEAPAEVKPQDPPESREVVEAPAPVVAEGNSKAKPEGPPQTKKVVEAPAPVAARGASEVKPQDPAEPKKVVVEAAKKQIERSNTDTKLQHFNRPLPKPAEGTEPPLPWRSTKLTNRRHTLGTLNEEDKPAKEVNPVQPTKGNNIKEIKEFWGKNAKGFAGPAIGATSRLSKCEAQATLQRLIAAGGAVDFDEVRRLRKMIAELD